MNNQDNILQTYTFLFTDIEGSTKLLKELKEKYADLLFRHQEIIKSVILKHKGEVEDTAGDGMFCVFKSAKEAVKAAITIQNSISLFNSENDFRLRIRTGIHTGEAIISLSGYTGYDIHLTARIMSSGHGGQILISETTQKIIEHDRSEDYEIKFLGEYMLKDIELPQKIYQINYQELDAEFPALKASKSAHTNLPSDIVKLIGREKDIESVCYLLKDTGTKLVTITGPGGMGKTSLALNACRDLAGNFVDGVFSVMLSDVYDVNLIPESIATSMQISEKIYSDENKLLEYLKSKQTLFLLDNFEQIGGEPIFISNMLNQCPEIKLIVTSRIPLKLKLECEYELTPLKLPDVKGFTISGDVSEYPAVKLFEDRAAKIKSGFTINETNAYAVAEICHQLDGLPLAIELACARIKIFSPQQILQKLNDKLNLLKVSETDRPKRHHTIRDTIAWSYELLNEKEKILFEAVSVFTGGCTFEALEYVCRDLFENDIELIDTLQNLSEKHLIKQQVDRFGNERYSMLVTIQEFAKEKLIQKDILLKELQIKCSEFYLKLSEEAEKYFTGKDLKHWLDVIETDLVNIRNCINRSEEAGDSSCALKFCAALWRYWIIRGNLNHDYKQVKSILDMPYDENMKSVRAKVLNGIGTMLHELSDYKLSYPHIEESLKLYKELNDTSGMLNALLNLSWVSIHLGELSKAEDLCKEVFSVNEKAKDKRVSALLYNNLGWLNIMRGNFIEAKKNYLISKEMREAIEDRRGIGFVISNIAWIDTFLGDYENAEINFKKSIDIIKEIDDKQLLGWVTTNYGFYDFCRYELESADLRLTESFRLLRDVYNEWVMSYENLLLGFVKYHMNFKDEAEEHIKKSLSFFQKSGSRWGIQKSKIFQSYLLIDSGDYKEAFVNLKEALGFSDYLSDKYGYAQLFECFSCLCSKLNLKEHASKFLSVSSLIRKDIHAPLSKPESVLLDKFAKDVNVDINNTLSIDKIRLLIHETNSELNKKI